MIQRCGLLAFAFLLVPATGFAAPDSTAAESARGIDRSPATPSTMGPWWIGVWAGAANNSRFQTRHGRRDRDLRMAGVRVGRQMFASRRFAFDYFVDVVPWIRSTNIPVEYTQTVTCRPGNTCTEIEVMETATVRGYGLTPIGLQMRAFPGNLVELVFGMSFGAAMYDRPVPDPDEKRLNFMGDLTAGVQVRLGHSGALLAGFRQNHTSNANTGPANTGMDSRVVYVGATRSLGRRSRP